MLVNNTPLPINCHCGSNRQFNDCCNVFISLKLLPQTSEQLMRSRFTAFKLRIHQYLIDTVVNQASNAELRTQDFDININWLGLKILSTKQGKPSDQSGYVEFVAFYQLTQINPSAQENNNPIEQLHENSYFEKYGEQWFYLSGEPLSNIKLNRNNACFCGSGKKVKKCHLI